jgi:hypothetical protein
MVVATAAVFDQEVGAAAAEFARVFEKDVGFLSVHFLQDDDVVGINLRCGSVHGFFAMGG